MKTKIRFLSRDEVATLLPSTTRQVDLAEQTFRAVAAGRVELPPKPGIHPRPNAFIHAMPSYLIDDDVAAIKWVSGYPANPGNGLPYISGVVVLNDASTGIPTAILDAAEITAARTAAATGVCIRRFAPDGGQTVAILGCGEQARYHLRVINELIPDVCVRAWDPIASRAALLGETVEPAPSARAAVNDASILITAAPIVEHPDPPVARDWLRDFYLVVPIDFDASVQRGVIEDADLFLVDDLAQFDHYRHLGHFESWPEPHATLGADTSPAQSPVRIACVNLGIGALDAAFAAEVLRHAEEHHVGELVTI